jgi:hypothetical protein
VKNKSIVTFESLIYSNERLILTFYHNIFKILDVKALYTDLQYNREAYRTAHLIVEVSMKRRNPFAALKNTHWIRINESISVKSVPETTELTQLLIASIS